MKYRIKHILEYGVLRALIGMMNILPYRVSLALACGIAWILHFIFQFRRQEALRRIEEVFGDGKSLAEMKRIAWISWRNLCFNIVEMARGQSLDRAWVEKHVDTKHLAESKKWLEENKGGLIFCTMHMGNWDLGGLVIRLMGMPAFFIARRQRNPLTNEYLNRMRQSQGEKIISSDEPNIIRSVGRRLKQGEVLAILPDVRLNAEGMKIQYLGKEANLAPGVGAMSSLARCPVFPGIMIRHGWCRFELIPKPPIFPNPEAKREEDIRRIIVEAIDGCTEWVHEFPEQYFWYNRRWVLEPYPSE